MRFGERVEATHEISFLETERSMTKSEKSKQVGSIACFFMRGRAKSSSIPVAPHPGVMGHSSNGPLPLDHS